MLSTALQKLNSPQHWISRADRELINARGSFLDQKDHVYWPTFRPHLAYVDVSMYDSRYTLLPVED